MNRKVAEKMMRDEVEKIDKKFAELYGVKPLNPTVVFEKRGTVAGTATYDTMTIDLNYDAYRVNPLNMMNDTIPHEVAHLYSYKIYGRRKGRGHGQAWKSVMVRGGYKPERCYKAETYAGLKRARKVKRFKYVVGCGCEFELSTRMHNAVQSGQKRHCVKHGSAGQLSEIHWTGEVRVSEKIGQ